jgi:diadenosine tetraphosphate (Ap4A) HIT family hydrolase
VRDKHCTFCRLSRGDNSQKYEELFEANGSREVLASFEIGVIVPDISPLVDGHVMLVSHAHIGSYSEIEPSQANRIGDFLAVYRNICFQMYGTEVIAFEHGVPLSSDGKNTCVEHAHIHIVPLKHGSVFDDVVKRLNLSLAPRLTLKNGSNHYLAAWDRVGRLWLSEANRFESQVFRREIGAEIGELLWHWEDRLLFEEKKVAQEHYMRTVQHAKEIVSVTAMATF